MSWYRHNGKVLKIGGKIAIAAACCCDICGCPNEPVGNLKAIFRATGACSIWDGLEVILEKQGGSLWSSGFIPEWAGIQGWHDTVLHLSCGTDNPDGPPCKDYGFAFENDCRGGGQEVVPIESCSCEPFELITGTIFQLIGGMCCELCSCDLFADTTFHWEIVEA